MRQNVCWQVQEPFIVNWTERVQINIHNSGRFAKWLLVDQITFTFMTLEWRLKMFPALTILPVGIWAAITAVYNDVNCWAADSTHYGYIVDGPRIITLAVSSSMMVRIKFEQNLYPHIQTVCVCRGARNLQAFVFGHLDLFLMIYSYTASSRICLTPHLLYMWQTRFRSLDDNFSYLLHKVLK
jgi:hypothetical protein